MPRLHDVSKAVAYQRLQLLDIQKLYDELDQDLDHYLAAEQSIADEILALEQEFVEIKKSLSSSKINLPEESDPLITSDDFTNDSLTAPVKSYEKIEVYKPDSLEALIAKAENYLLLQGIDSNKDPLLQVLSSREIAAIEESYRKKYGDISWDQSDYVVVILAGLIATLLDIFLVKIPGDTNFFGKLQKGSPLTKWIKENSIQIHEKYLKPLEEMAKVPYDSPTSKNYGQSVKGLRPDLHRIMSLGHDPILGFIFGVLDVMKGTGTFIDGHGNLIRVERLSAVPESDLTTAFTKVLLHLLSDVFTKSGIQPPFFTLLQLVKAQSPFALREGGPKVSWTDVARYMYGHGYDLRHFFTMGIVPATVEIIIRGYWLLRNFEEFEEKEERERIKVKMTSMLLLGHTIALSGNLIKTGLIFQMNPLALNWAQILAFTPVILSWINESIKRQKFIRAKLDEEWIHIYSSTSTF